MSIPRSTTITCPKCGKAIQATTFVSLNTDYAPDVAESVISGKRFDCKCPSCGNVSHLCYDFLYHDIKHNAMIWLVGRETPEAQEKINEIRSVRTPDVKTTRIVQDIPSLREKAACLEAGRDDKIIELCKVFLEIELMNQQPDLRVQRSFYTYENGREIVFIYDSNRKELHTELDDKIYFVVSELFEKLLSSMEETPYQIIDHEWAAEVFGKLHEAPPDLEPDTVANKYHVKETSSSAELSELICPDCGMALPEDSEFCQYCGAVLSSDSPLKEKETLFEGNDKSTGASSTKKHSQADTQGKSRRKIKPGFLKVLIWLGFAFGYGLCVTVLSYAGVRGGLVAIIVAVISFSGAKMACGAIDDKVSTSARITNQTYETPVALKRDESQDKSEASDGTEHVLRRNNETSAQEKTMGHSPADTVDSGEESHVLDLRQKGLSPTLRRAFLLIEDGEWEKADRYLERVLDDEPENAFAYYGKLLFERRAKDYQELKENPSGLEDNKNYQKAVRYSDDDDLTSLLSSLSNNCRKQKSAGNQIQNGKSGEHFSHNITRTTNKKKQRRQHKKRNIALFSLLAIVIAACGTVLGSYFCSKQLAQAGEYEKAQRFLFLPAVTNLIDPQLTPFIKAGISYQSALERLEKGELQGLRIILRLCDEGFSPAKEGMENTKDIAYSWAVKYYHSGDKNLAAGFFSKLGNYKKSKDYMALCEESNYSKIKQLIGFEDADQILLDSLALKFLAGTWKDTDGALYFSLNGADRTTSYNLPHSTLSNSYYTIEDGELFLFSKDSSGYSIANGSYERVYNFRFNIIDENTILVYCYADGSTHTLYRQ